MVWVKGIGNEQVREAVRKHYDEQSAPQIALPDCRGPGCVVASSDGFAYNAPTGEVRKPRVHCDRSLATQIAWWIFGCGS